MTTPTFQTIRLCRGRHETPEDGACVMELASMLAGERFSDHPRAVCPVIGMVLRAYNDGIDDDRRQDLYAYASAAVGTRDRRARRDRAERCARFFGCPPPRLLGSRLKELGVTVLRYARGADPETHGRFLALLDELTGCRQAVRTRALTTSAAPTRAGRTISAIPTIAPGEASRPPLPPRAV